MCILSDIILKILTSTFEQFEEAVALLAISWPWARTNISPLISASKGDVGILGRY